MGVKNINSCDFLNNFEKLTKTTRKQKCLCNNTIIVIDKNVFVVPLQKGIIVKI